MFRLVNGIRTYTSEGNQFKGYWRAPYGEAGSFWDMRNLSGTAYPLIRTRKKRRKVRSFEGCSGLFGHDKLGWIDENYVYWDGQQVGELSPMPGDKQIVEMGALAVIFPDKVMVNTDTGAFSSLENTAAPTGNVVYTACDLMGESQDYRTAVYVKVEAAGIGAGFKENDVIYANFSDVLDGYYQIYSVTADSFVVLETMEEQTVTQTDGTATFARTVPDMDYVTECDNRIWGCSSEAHEIYCCALGDPTNWRVYQGLAGDSYAATVGTPGAFTGAATHLGYVLFFKEDVIHKVFGTKPSNFQVTTVHARGVEKGSARSLCVMNETLHYLSRTGMVAYEGSLPADIGAAFGDVKYKNARAAANDGQMWVSMQDSEGIWNLFVYNGSTGLWYREDLTMAVAFRNVNGSMYMATQTALWVLDGPGDARYEDRTAANEGTLTWSAMTGDLNMADLFKRHLQKVELRMRIGLESSCEVKVQYDGGEWETLKEITWNDDMKALSIAMVPRRCDHMRLALTGQGEMELMEIRYRVWSGSEL